MILFQTRSSKQFDLPIVKARHKNLSLKNNWGVVMLTSISFGDEVKSKVTRLSFLPRFGFTCDFLGYHFEYRQAPMTELLYNMYKKGMDKDSFIEVVKTQLTEIDFKRPKKSVAASRNQLAKKKVTKKKVAKKKTKAKSKAKS